MVFLNILRLSKIISILKYDFLNHEQKRKSVYLIAQSFNENLLKLIYLTSIMNKFLQIDLVTPDDCFLDITSTCPLSQRSVSTQPGFNHESAVGNYCTTGPLCLHKDNYRLHALKHCFRMRMATMKAKIDGVYIKMIYILYISYKLGTNFTEKILSLLDYDYYRVFDHN